MVLLHPTAFGREANRWVGHLSRAKPHPDSPSVPVFLLVNALAGATIGGAIPGRPPIQDRATVAAVVVLVWLFIAFLTHQVCRLFGTTRKLSATVACMLMLLSVVYVTSNLTIFVAVGAVRAFPSLLRIEFLDEIRSDPGPAIVLMEFALTLMLLPLMIRGLHNFRLWQVIGTSVCGALATLFLAFAVLANGGC
jgi:hypothetical protein